MNTENISIWSYIIIDDDPINNHICKKYIKISCSGADVVTFTDPQEGVDYVRLIFANGRAEKTILLLDINMPILTGWDVLEILSKFNPETLRQLKIFILSSSVAKEDRERAETSSLVSGFLEKPLTAVDIQRIQFA